VTTANPASTRLARAIVATFARRRTAIPTEKPDALTSTFAEDPVKRRQWTAFISDIDTAASLRIDAVIDDLAVFLMEAAMVARSIEAKNM
jgi:hypothetical protein